jgi:hypothetical protein
VKHRKPHTSLFDTEDQTCPRVSNTSWAYGTANDLFVGEEHERFTPYEWHEHKYWEQEIAMEQDIAARYGDCGAPITGTITAWETYEEEARIAWGLPAAWGF